MTGQGKLVLKRTAKAVAANVLHYTGIRKAIASVRRARSGGRRILILSYHRPVDDFTGAVQNSIPGLLISKETLRRQLEDIARSGYEFSTLQHALDVMSGRRIARKDLCVVTFDDGYRDVYRHAYPVLKQLGIPWVIYVPSGLIGTDKRFHHDQLFHLFQLLQQRRFRPLLEALPPTAADLVSALADHRTTPAAAVDAFLADHAGTLAQQLIDALMQQLGGGPELIPEHGDIMTWDELRELSQNGVEVGAHTVSHSVLPLEDPERAGWEIRTSKAEIERQLGKPCLDFAYCNGWYSDELIRLIVQAGFRSAVTTEDLANRIGGDPYTLKRKVLWENFSLGYDGTYSSCLTGCQMDDVFTSLGGGTVVIGRKPQRGAPGLVVAAPSTAIATGASPTGANVSSNTSVGAVVLAPSESGPSSTTGANGNLSVNVLASSAAGPSLTAPTPTNPLAANVLLPTSAAPISPLASDEDEDHRGITATGPLGEVAAGDASAAAPTLSASPASSSPSTAPSPSSLPTSAAPSQSGSTSASAPAALSAQSLDAAGTQGGV